MIFKQQLFIILLGLLFTTVLTDQASALYDPGVGRFCSRDPIGYVDGNCMQCMKWGLSGTDPSGELHISAKVIGKTIPAKNHRGCGKWGNVRWSFELSPPPSKDPNDIPPCKEGYLGYIIQKVVVKCRIHKCAEDCKCLPLRGKTLILEDDAFAWDDYTYYEAWDVSKTGVISGRHADDIGKINIPQNSCGYHSQTGELKYFCKEDANILGTPGSTWGMTDECNASSGFLPSTDAENVWRREWRVKARGIAGGDGGTDRSITGEWNCCGDQKDKWVHFDWSPKI